jgi:nicotinate-nucleotide adenylyltransferase
MRRIGILGGTFDPPHIGHFIIADEVKTKLTLDEIWFIPTNEPPHKATAATHADHRFEMLRVASAQMEGFYVNKVELERRGKSYTIDTIKRLKQAFPTYQFYFIIGADMVEYLPKWKKINELFGLVQFVGVMRSHYSLKTDYPIITVQVPLIDISSTEIKQRALEGRDVRYFLPHEVYIYMKEHALYEHG